MARRLRIHMAPLPQEIVVEEREAVVTGGMDLRSAAGLWFVITVEHQFIEVPDNPTMPKCPRSGSTRRTEGNRCPDCGAPHDTPSVPRSP